LISKANNEEKNVEKLDGESKLNRKTIIFTARIDDIIKMKSIGEFTITVCHSITNTIALNFV
jgi:hypothetical protein